MGTSHPQEDLNQVIRQHSEWLATQLHAQRESLFPPDAAKAMRTFSSGEAAALLGTTEKAIETRIYRARNRLRERVKNFEGFS